MSSTGLQDTMSSVNDIDPVSEVHQPVVVTTHGAANQQFRGYGQSMVSHLAASSACKRHIRNEVYIFLCSKL